MYLHTKLIVIGAAAGTLIGSIAGCGGSPTETTPAKSPVNSVLVTEVDGCKLYRITELGYNSTYLAKCEAGTTKPVKKVPVTAVTRTTEGCGKSCTREIVTTTVTVPE